MRKEELIDLLKKDVVPALGCTEPVCVALCAAYASKQLNNPINKIELDVNKGIYKNGMSAGIPHCEHVGLEYAASIGALLKNPEKQLTLFEDIGSDTITQAELLVPHVSITINDSASIDVKCILHTSYDTVTCMIKDAHTNIVYLEKNGVVLEEKTTKQTTHTSTVIDKLKEMRISEIRSLVDSMTVGELEFLLDGIRMNEQLSEYKGTTHLSDSFNHSLFSEDLFTRIIKKVTASAENRLDGCPLPAMSSSGAGTKGLVVSIPVNEVAEELHVSLEKKLKALTHLVNRYINAHIGKLSPMCTCVMASSTAASVGIAYLLDASDEQIGYCIRNMAGTVTGMICDGGKVGCALKVSTGSSAALMCATTAVNNAVLRESDGICASTPEQCIQNMVRIGKNGMIKVDEEIISIMKSKG